MATLFGALGPALLHESGESGDLVQHAAIFGAVIDVEQVNPFGELLRHLLRQGLIEAVVDKNLSAASFASSFSMPAATTPSYSRVQVVAVATRAVRRGLARVEPARRHAGRLFCAPMGGEAAIDGEGTANSPFAAALVHHLKEPGLEISLLFRKIYDTVLNKTRGEQEPFTYGALPAEALYFKVAGSS